MHKHTVDCEKPQVSDVITLMYNSTLEGSVLMYSCEDPTCYKRAVCQGDGSWTPSILCGGLGILASCLLYSMNCN